MLKKENLTPTVEQEAILSATGHRVKINARAGTGKTATMQMLAERLTDSRGKILYLAFNDRTKQQAQSKFGHSAIVRTVHSFALSCVPKNHGIKRKLDEESARAKKSGKKPAWPEFTPVNLLEYYGIESDSAQLRAVLAHRFLIFFLNSELPDLDSSVEPFSRSLSPKLKNAFRLISADSIEAIRSFIGKWTDGLELCPHDYYLKRAIEEGWFAKKLARYSILLVDEAQDLSPVMVGVIKDFSGRVFVVGDSHQQIYLFRHAIDALNLVKADQSFELTKSFRFGKPIAPIVMNFIREAKRERDFVIHGSEKVQSSAEILGETSRPISPGGAVIARTNYGLFKVAIELLQKGVPVAFNREVGDMIRQTQAVYQLSLGESPVAKGSFIGSFQDLQQLKAHAEEFDDRKLLGIIQLVEEYGRQLPGILRKLSAVRRRDPADTSATDILLTTIHGAKGLEFPEVRLCNDMFWKLSSALKEKSSESDEETNMVYVAMTRAQNRLVLPPCASELPIDWPNLDRHSSDTAAIGVTAKSGHTLKPLIGSSTTGRKARSAPRQREPKLGARVRTPLGSGSLVIDGSDKSTHLVKLDTQASPVRLMKRRVQSE